ncbi:MAG: hypothetical protein GY820_19530 [Gammaproteobacteria bacterium]|nr:hypothetical protein [Gammaproteobacteria bacterium]
MKRDQESERFNRKLLEEDKTTDKFKYELSDTKDCRQFTSSELSDTKDCRQLTSLNQKELSDITSPKTMEPGPYVKATPIQCVNPIQFRINVEGQWVNFVVDAGVVSSIVVPERVANQILARKSKTLDAFLNSMAPTNSNVQIDSFTGGDGPIIGQAVVTLKNGDVECPTEMLVMRTDNKEAESLVGNNTLLKLGLASVSPKRNKILERNVAGTPPSESSQATDAPVKLPKAVRMQVSLSECHSIAPMDMVGSNNDCSSNGLTESVQQGISRLRDAEVVTKSSASRLECDQVSIESKLNRHHQQQQRVPWQKCRTRHMNNKLRHHQKKAMLVEGRRYRRHRGKMKFISVIPHRWQGDNQATAQSKSVPRDAKNGSTESPVQFFHTVRPCRVNRRKRGRIRGKFSPQLPIYQTAHRQRDKLHCDGISRAIGTGIAPKPKCTEMSLNSLRLEQGKNVPRNAKTKSMESFRLEVNREMEGRKQSALGNLSEGVTAKQTVQSSLDEDEEEEKTEGLEHREGSLCESLLDGVKNRHKKIQWK